MVQAAPLRPPFPNHTRSPPHPRSHTTAGAHPRVTRGTVRGNFTAPIFARRHTTAGAYPRVTRSTVRGSFTAPIFARRSALHGIAVRREVDDLFQQAVPLGNTVPRDELKDLVPDAELSLPRFNVVTGSYDPRSLKSTLLEFKTMRYGVKYTSVPRATAVDRFERSLLGDIQRGLAARDAAWHNTEPGQKGPLRDIMDMSEYTGMVFGTVGEVSKGVHRTTAQIRLPSRC
eukprot:jgi/Tetstr1/460645/TSEL_005841.t1